MPVKDLVDKFNSLSGNAAICQKAFLQHGRPDVMAGKEAQMLTFEGLYSTGAPFQVSSPWMRCDANLDQAVADVVNKILETKT